MNKKTPINIKKQFRSGCANRNINNFSQGLQNWEINHEKLIQFARLRYRINKQKTFYNVLFDRFNKACFRTWDFHFELVLLFICIEKAIYHSLISSNLLQTCTMSYFPLLLNTHCKEKNAQVLISVCKRILNLAPSTLARIIRGKNVGSGMGIIICAIYTINRLITIDSALVPLLISNNKLSNFILQNNDSWIKNLAVLYISSTLPSLIS